MKHTIRITLDIPVKDSVDDTTLASALASLDNSPLASLGAISAAAPHVVSKEIIRGEMQYDGLDAARRLVLGEIKVNGESCYEMAPYEVEELLSTENSMVESLAEQIRILSFSTDYGIEEAADRVMNVGFNVENALEAWRKKKTRGLFRIDSSDSLFLEIGRNRANSWDYTLYENFETVKVGTIDNGAVLHDALNEFLTGCNLENCPVKALPYDSFLEYYESIRAEVEKAESGLYRRFTPAECREIFRKYDPVALQELDSNWTRAITPKEYAQEIWRTKIIPGLLEKYHLKFDQVTPNYIRIYDSDGKYKVLSLSSGLITYDRVVVDEKDFERKLFRLALG